MGLAPLLPLLGTCTSRRVADGAVRRRPRADGAALAGLFGDRLGQVSEVRGHVVRSDSVVSVLGDFAMWGAEDEDLGEDMEWE